MTLKLPTREALFITTGLLSREGVPRGNIYDGLGPKKDQKSLARLTGERTDHRRDVCNNPPGTPRSKEAMCTRAPVLLPTLALQGVSACTLETGTVAMEATFLTFSKYFCSLHRPRNS